MNSSSFTRPTTSATATCRRFRAVFLLFSLGSVLAAQAVPVVSNVRASQRAGTKLVDVLYDLTGTGSMTVRMEVSPDNGVTFSIPAVTATGAFGAGVTAGVNKVLVWNAGVDFDGRYTPQTKVKVVAIDAGGQPTPAGMEYIPAGGGIGLFTGAFYMDRYEVTKLLYDTVVGWASTRGYGFSGGTAGNGGRCESPRGECKLV